MTWTEIINEKQLERIVECSQSIPCVIYKHSTKCSQSEMMKYVLEADWSFDSEEIKPYLLDIVKYQQIAGKIADKFEVYHQSPQILLIKNGICTYDADHLEISLEELKEMLVDDLWTL